MSLTVSDLVIDPEFRDKLRPLTDEERAELKRNIRERGRITDPILVWLGHAIVVDGHNRLSLYEELIAEGIDIPEPEILEQHFASREAALYEIWWRQYARRNNTPKEIAYIRGELYNTKKADPAANLKAGNSPKRQNVASGKTRGKLPNSVSEPSSETTEKPSASAAAEVAELTGVNPRTIQRDGAYAEALDAIGKVNGKARDDILQGTLKVAKKDVLAIGKLDREGIGNALRNIRQGQKWNAGMKPAGTGKPSDGKSATGKTFDDTQIDKRLEQLARLFDDKARAEGGQGSQHAACMSSLKELNRDWQNWKKQK